MRSLPTTVVRAHRIERDWVPDGYLDEPEWHAAPAFPLEQQVADGVARPEVSTPCRALWSDRFLYLSFVCPCTTITDFGPAQPGERVAQDASLWDRDVVEFFCAPDPTQLTHYTEYEWAPNNEALDLRIRKPEFDFQWSSHMDWRVRHTPGGREWTCEVRIPLEALADRKPEAGTRWRANFYRIDRAHRAFLASNPVLNGSFHTHDRFGWLEFAR